MSVAAFTFAALALTTTAVLGAAMLRLRGPSLPIGAYVLGWAAVVGLGEVLSLLDLVGRVGYVVSGALVLAAVAAGWHALGRPLPQWPSVRWAALRRHPQLTALGVVVVGALGYQLFLAVATPPNNGDSLAYHLPRVVAWLQQGHAGYFDAPTGRANVFPGNAELGVLWTVALLGRDTFAALPQFLAELGLLAGVYGCGRRLGFSRAAASFGALLTATLSEVALQSVTEQNDLVTAALVVAAAYFVLGRDRRELPLGALAAALAVGTKLTGLLALPLLAVVALTVLPRRHLVALAGWTVVAFAGFGAFWYVENSIRTHHPLGVLPEADSYRQPHALGPVASTAAKVSWRFVDFSGLPAPDGLLTGLASTGEHLFEFARIDPSPRPSVDPVFGFDFEPSTRAYEDSSYFGPLGFLLLIPLSFGFALAWLCRRASPAQGALAVGLPLFVLAVAVTQRYNTWLGRFMLVPAAVTLPLSAWLYDRRLRLLTGVAAAVGAVTLVGTHLHNVAKPVGLSGSPAVWTLPRLDATTVNVGGTPRCALQLVDSVVPENAALGVVLGNNDPEYLLYGPGLRRRLVNLPAHDATHVADAHGLRWIVVSPSAGVVRLAPQWHAQALRGRWQLLRKHLGSQSLATAPVEAGCRPVPVRRLAVHRQTATTDAWRARPYRSPASSSIRAIVGASSRSR